MKHRPFNELTKDWPPERVAASEAKVKEMLAELDRQEREQIPDGRTSRRTSRATERAPSRSPELTR